MSWHSKHSPRIRAPANVGLLRIADVLFAGTVTGFTLHTFQVSNRWVPYLKSRLDNRVQWYGKRHTPHQNSVPFSGGFQRRKRVALPTIGGILVRGTSDMLSLRRIHFVYARSKCCLQQKECVNLVRRLFRRHIRGKNQLSS